MKKNCQLCGNILTQKHNESKYDFSIRKFCNRECWKKSTQIELVCPNCKTCFITYPSRQKGYRIYCSKTCYEIHNRRSESIDSGVYQCTKCLQVKSIDQFYKRKTLKRGFESKCNKCTNHDKALNVQHRISKNLRTRIWEVLKRNVKSGSTIDLMGCKPSDLMRHLETKFQIGMIWENYGSWHIDHIIPCSYFDLTNPEEQAKCFHYTNLQPLWAKENLSKGNKYEG